MVEMLREASWLWEDVGVDGRNMYAKSGAVGDRKIVVELYGRDCAFVCPKTKVEAAAKIPDMCRILPENNCRKFT